jgi:glycosyltransferase involved in cell wall biosynthesis
MKKKICFIATLEMSIKAFLVGHMLLLQEIFDLSVLVNTENIRFLEPFGIRALVMPVKVERKISLYKDVKVLFDLYGIFKRERFEIVHSIMPKSGFLSMLAGFFAGVPVRVHTFTGQVWKNSSGSRRFILKTMDKILVSCATHILVDSPSQREFLISEGIVNREKSSVIGNGSMCGVDEKKFYFDEVARCDIRKTLGIASEDIVFFFLGRMNRDKGILDLARAFVTLCGRYGNAHLLLVGPDEENMGERVLEICSQCSENVHIMGYVDRPEKHMSAADIFCLPSYREGFGLVIIEAAAVGIPSIGSRIYGITDTIDEGITGFLFQPGDLVELSQKMCRFVEEPGLIKKMGKEAQKKALQLYARDKITAAMLDYYKTLINRQST